MKKNFISRITKSRKTLLFGVILLAFILVVINKKDSFSDDKSVVKVLSLPYKNINEDKKYEYGIFVDTLQVAKGVVQNNDLFGKIMHNYNVSDAKILKILSKSKDIFDFERNLLPQKNYTVLYNRDDTINRVQYFIYEEDLINYIVVDLTDTISVSRRKKEVVKKLKVTEGIIESSLSETVSALNVSDRIAIELSEIYSWTIDFFRIQKGDSFKVYYENKYVDSAGTEKYIGIGKILSAEFTHKSKNFYAFYYEENETFGDYFDENGMTLRKAFLKAPLNYYRISSRYSKKC